MSLRKIRQTAQAALNVLGCPDSELSILIVDDQRISALNQEYLQREGPTNVIAFPMQEGPFAEITPDLLGDVVISVDTTRREALDSGLDFQTRFTQLLVHGILHLLGYDHEKTEKDARKMEAKSEELLHRLETMDY